MRGRLTDRKELRSVLRLASIHLVIHILEREEDKLERNEVTEDDVFSNNVECTNSLLQVLGEMQHDICVIMLTSDLTNRPESVIGNSCRAAEAIFVGKAIRCDWRSVIVRTSYAEPPWGKPFVQWGYELWDGGCTFLIWQSA